jgi:hypothetical protein
VRRPDNRISCASKLRDSGTHNALVEKGPLVPIRKCRRATGVDPRRRWPAGFCQVPPQSRGAATFPKAEPRLPHQQTQHGARGSTVISPPACREGRYYSSTVLLWCGQCTSSHGRSSAEVSLPAPAGPRLYIHRARARHLPERDPARSPPVQTWRFDFLNRRTERASAREFPGGGADSSRFLEGSALDSGRSGRRRGGASPSLGFRSDRGGNLRRSLFDFGLLGSVGIPASFVQ